MSNNYTSDDLDLDDNEDATDIRSLRKAAESAKKLKAENAKLQREIAFAKAGLPLSDPKMNYFIKGYDGELEAEAIREAAAEAGFISNQVEQANEQRQAQQQVSLEAQGRVMSASAGAFVEDASEMAALGRMEAAMNEGGMDAMLDVVRQYGIPIASEQ
jgi:hypothetical protein